MYIIWFGAEKFIAISHIYTYTYCMKTQTHTHIDLKILVIYLYFYKLMFKNKCYAHVSAIGFTSLLQVFVLLVGNHLGISNQTWT